MSAPAMAETRKTMLPRHLPIVIAVAALIITVVVICAVLGERIAPYSPFLQRLGVGDTSPSAAHIAGTDLLAPWLTIVGVATDVPQRGAPGDLQDAIVYVPYRAEPEPVRSASLPELLRSRSCLAFVRAISGGWSI